MIMHVLYVTLLEFERAFEFAAFGQTTLSSLSLSKGRDGHSYSWINPNIVWTRGGRVCL